MTKPENDLRLWKSEHLNGTEILHARRFLGAYPKHSHETFTVAVVQKGQFTFDHKAGKQLASHDHIFVINPEEVHTGTFINPLEGSSYSVLYPSLGTLSQMVGKEQIFFKDHVMYDPMLSQSLRMLHCALQHADELEIESRWHHSIHMLVSRHAKQQTPETLQPRPLAVLKTKQYLHEHAPEAVRLQDLADHVGLSPFHLLRLFTKEVGMPPHAYLTQLRVRMAKELLYSGRALIDVALDTGFPNQSHFTTQFKKYMGMTPGKMVQSLRASGY